MNETLNKKSIYFPSLNGIRFIAAVLVFLHHFVAIDYVRKNIGFSMEGSFLSPMGGTGVTLFFVLSGYLITYLLLTEYKIENKISIKDFYIRRLLRIWPLYFLTIAINLLYAYFSSTLTPDFFTTRLILYTFFLPNVASILFISGGFPTQLWSVGSEEQFYLFWPWVIKLFRKKIKIILISIPVVFFVMRFLLYFLISYKEPVFFKGINVLDFFNQFINNFRVDCMVIGACFATLLFYKHKFLDVFYSKIAQVIAMFLIIALILFGFNTPVINYPIYSFLFGIIILNLSSNKLSLFNLKHRLFEELGKISYGLYVFHPFVLLLTDKYIKKFTFNSSIGLTLMFVISFGLTILLSYLSFRFFESPFLKLKHKFSKIISGNEAQQAA